MALVVNASTTAVLIDTSQFPTSNYQEVVLVSSVGAAAPGRTVTIRDSIGYLSTPQRIIVSTTSGLRFNDGTSSVTITQPFGYITLTSRDSTSWNLTNSFGFPQNQAFANLSQLSTGALAASTIQASDFISTGHLVTYTMDTTSSLVTTGRSYLSSAIVNIAPGGPTDLTYASTLSSTSFFVNGNTHITGDLDLSGNAVLGSGPGNDVRSYGLLRVDGTLNTKYAYIYDSMYLYGNFESPFANVQMYHVEANGSASFVENCFVGSTMQVLGDINVGNTISTSYLTANTMQIASTLTFNEKTIQNRSNDLLFSHGIDTPGISTNYLTAATSIATGEIYVTNAIHASNLSSFVMNSAAIENPNGSLQISSIATNTATVQDYLTVRGPTTLSTMQALSLTLSGDLNATFPGYLNMHTGIFSSITTNTAFADNIFARQFTTGSITASTLTVTDEIRANSISTFQMSNAIVNNSLGSFQTSSLRAATVTTSSLTIQTGRFNTVSSLQIGAPSVIMNAATMSTVYMSTLYTSSLTTNKLIVGEPIDPANLGPYFVCTASTNCIVTGGPGNYLSPFFISNVKPPGYVSNTSYYVRADFQFIVPTESGFLPGNFVNFSNALYWANELDCASYLSILVSYGVAPPWNPFTVGISGLFGYYAANQQVASAFPMTADYAPSNVIFEAYMYNDSGVLYTLANTSNSNFNIVNSSNTVNMQNSILRWNYALNATTIQNTLNDIATRNLQYFGSLTSVSDPRVKEDIKVADLRRCYDTIKRLPLRYYRFKDAYLSTFQIQDAHRIGFIADELEQEFPRSIQIQDSVVPGYSTLKTIDTSQVEMAHLGATKYLMNEVSTLKATVQASRAQLSTLESLGPK